MVRHLKRYHRKLIQLFSALIYNANLDGFFTGTISKSASKSMCVPGLNCYSCPGAIGACPVGALQSAFGELRYKLPLYVLGILLLFGVLLGRAVCGFLCPFGLVQELLHKIPSPKLKKNRLTRGLTLLKYVVLAGLVVGYPVMTLLVQGVAVPGFCKFLCPAGTLEGGIPLPLLDETLRPFLGGLFQWKFAILLLIVAASVVMYRPFCRFLCPLGAIYSPFNRIAVLGVRLDENKCIHCDRCIQACGMDVRKVNDRECIRCGECIAVCPCDAISIYSFRTKQEGQTDETA